MAPACDNQACKRDANGYCIHCGDQVTRGADPTRKLMTPEEIDRFWEHANQTAAEVDTWPAWMRGGTGFEPIKSRAEWLKSMAQDGAEAL